MNRTQRKLERLVHKQLDKIYSTCVSITKEWGVDKIALRILFELIKKSKVKPNEDIDYDWTIKYNEMLDLLFKTCAVSATDKEISYKLLRRYIDTVKENFTKGLKK